MQKKPIQKKAWVVAVDMGYGHQRAAYPLRDLAFSNQVINANSYAGIPEKDRAFWKQMRWLYEFISRFKKIPVLGTAAFAVLDWLQRVLAYYPKRDLSKPTLLLRNNFYFIKKGWGRDLIERFKKNPLPIVTTFFMPAFLAEEHRYPAPVYCMVCDADFNRAWASLHPKKSGIRYFAPCDWAANRLRLYGVPEDQITLTGFPLPKENVGKDMEIAKEDLRHRLLNLDPTGKFQSVYAPMVKGYLGELPKKPNHPLTVMFSIGGAGAQKELCLEAIKSLAKKIRERKLRFIIAIGVREELRAYFTQNLRGLQLGQGVRIISAVSASEYFASFNEALRETDALWTKPSELSFYAGLGIPIIIAPTIGSQEDFNKRWLLSVGAGVEQGEARYAHEWLFDLLETGDLAEMAMEGFSEIEKMGTYAIESIIQNS